MATGSGKTIVMAMLIAWQVLNKVTYPQDKRFSKNIFIVAPGLTVKNRLQVLIPGPNDYYREFSLIPSGLEDKLRQGKIAVAIGTHWIGIPKSASPSASPWTNAARSVTKPTFVKSSKTWPRRKTSSS